MEPEQQTTQNYFTEDLEERMKMSEEEMFQLLLNLEQSEYWPAILRYNQIRLSLSQSAVFSGDPVKEPTNISRHQGIMLGLSDLQNTVIQLVQNREQENKENEKKGESKKD